MYDGHDKLTSGTFGSEAPVYDKNGNETSLSVYGTSYTYTYDDEDRLTKLTSSRGIVDTFAYNGLGLRVAKSDSTGSYSYVCDGTTPGSPVLSDGHTVFTAGLSSTINNLTLFRHEDLLGSLRFQTDSSQSVTGSGLFEAFGAPVGATGTTMPFGFVGGADCQTEADTGLVLMGHRYYDSRIGRFLTPDPAKSGVNWYRYANDNPVNSIDPSGLETTLYQVPNGWSQAQIEAYTAQNYGDGTYDIKTNGKVTGSFTVANMLFGNSSAGLALGVTGEFMQGTNNHNRYYNASSTQSRQMKSSTSYGTGVLGQIIEGKKHGSVGTLAAFGYTLLDSLVLNGTEAQVGAYTWSFVDPNNPSAGIDIKNDITYNSLFYHLPEPLGNRPNLEFDPGAGTFGLYPNHYEDPTSGAFGTIHQTFHLNFP